MRAIKMIIAVLICVSFVGGCAGIKKALNFSSEPSEEKIIALAADIPESGEYVVEAAGDDLFAGADFKIALISQKENSVIVEAPLPANKTEVIDWKISASIGYTDGQKWIVVPQDDYKRDTTIESGHAAAKIVLPKKGNGWYWVRVWGENDNPDEEEKWLEIKTDSKYIRNSADNKPGYEFLVHPGSGKSQPVLEKYNKRR